MATIKEILEKSMAERISTYRAVGIEKVIIDGNPFTDYGAFSFIYEKSYVTSPERAGDGTIGNLNSYAWFVTPHLKIDFGLMSIDSYRQLMQLIYSKNEFLVTCYDVVYNKIESHKMYFTTEEMPKLWTIVEALNGDENAIMLLGVQDYTVEMVGTNSEVEILTLDYNLNVPSDVVWLLPTNTIRSFAKNTTVGIGDNAIIPIGVDGEGNDITTKMSNVDFDGKYQFKYWNTKPDGSGFSYIDGDEYFLRKDTMLFAIWQGSAV